MMQGSQDSYSYLLDCIEWQRRYSGFGNIEALTDIPSPEDCQDKCANHENCNMWMWYDTNSYLYVNPAENVTIDSTICYLKTGEQKGAIAKKTGGRVCKNHILYPVLLPNTIDYFSCLHPGLSIVQGALFLADA